MTSSPVWVCVDKQKAFLPERATAVIFGGRFSRAYGVLGGQLVVCLGVKKIHLGGTDDRHEPMKGIC